MKSFIVILAAAALCGCHQQRPKNYAEMSLDEKQAHLRSQAGAALLAESTNEVPGIRSIINIAPGVAAGPVSAWRGQVELDYINTLGGVDRTNLQMKYVADYGGCLHALPDLDYYDQQFPGRPSGKISERLSGRSAGRSRR